MRTAAATWPIWAALWGAVLPSFFLPHIDHYLHVHAGVEILRIYGEAALLYLPLALAISFVVAGASLAAVPLVRSEHLTCVQTISTWAARLLVAASVCELTNNWLKSAGLSHSLGLSQKFLILCASAIGAAAFTHRAPKPGRVLQGLQLVALLAIPMALIAILVRLPFPSSVNSAGPPQSASNQENPRDIVLITIDALSAMHMSVYGYGRETTPNLSRFASKATVFDRFYASGNWTQTGTASLLSGFRPWTARSDNPGIGPAAGSMDGNILKLAHEAGYEVLTVSTNVNASPNRQKVAPWVDDAVFPIPTESSMLVAYITNHLLGFYGEAADQGLAQTIAMAKSQSLFDRYLNRPPNQHYDPKPAFLAAETLWQKHSGKPRFLWVHIMPPHDPYAAPAPFLGTFDSSMDDRSYANTSITSGPGLILWYQARNQGARLNVLANRYDESVLYADHYAGGFIDWLAAHGDLDPSLVIVTSDHGESFHHEYSGHGGAGLYEELIHIPLLIKFPGQTRTEHVAAISEQVDLAPTVARWLSSPPSQIPYEGKVLARSDQASDMQDIPAFCMSLLENPDLRELRTGSIAMIDGPYKYIHYFGNLRYPEMPALRDQFYNVIEDPLETHDLSTDKPDVAARMKSAILTEMSHQGQRFSGIQPRR